MSITNFCLLSCVLTMQISMPIAVKQDKHQLMIKEYSCDVNPDSDEAILMNSFLAELNAIPRMDITCQTTADRIARLADTFIVPSYFEKYRIIKGTAHLNDYSGNEKLICVKSINGDIHALTCMSDEGLV